MLASGVASYKTASKRVGVVSVSRALFFSLHPLTSLRSSAEARAAARVGGGGRFLHRVELCELLRLDPCLLP